MTDTANPTREKIDQAITDLERLKMNIASIEARYKIFGDDFSNLCTEFLIGIKNSKRNSPVSMRSTPSEDGEIPSAIRQVSELSRSKVEVQDQLATENESNIIFETKRPASPVSEIQHKTTIRRKPKRRKKRNELHERAIHKQPVIVTEIEPSLAIKTKVSLIEKPLLGEDAMTLPAPSAVSERVRDAVKMSDQLAPQEQAVNENQPVLVPDEKDCVIVKNVPSEDGAMTLPERRQDQLARETEFSNSTRIYQSTLTDIIGTYTVNNIPKGDAREVESQVNVPPPAKKNAIDIAADSIEKGLDFIGNCIIYPVDKIIRLFSSKPRKAGK